MLKFNLRLLDLLKLKEIVFSIRYRFCCSFSVPHMHPIYHLKLMDKLGANKVIDVIEFSTNQKSVKFFLLFENFLIMLKNF